MSATRTDRVTEFVRAGAELEDALREVNELLEVVKTLADELDGSRDPISFETYGRMVTIYLGARIDVEQFVTWLDELQGSLRGIACDVPRAEVAS